MYSMRYSAGEVVDRAFLLGQHLSGLTDAAAAAHGLTTPRLQALFVLGHEGECQQSELARHLNCSPRQITALVDGLVASGHVTRRIPDGDRRVRLVALTAMARRIVEEIDSARAETAEELLADVDQSARDAFATVAELILERTGREPVKRLNQA